MAFVEVICKNCGGKIILDDKLKSGVCEYCKTTFVREEQNITNHFHNNTTVVYNTDSTIEEKLKSADVHLNKLNNYEKDYFNVTAGHRLLCLRCRQQLLRSLRFHQRHALCQNLVNDCCNTLLYFAHFIPHKCESTGGP